MLNEIIYFILSNPLFNLSKKCLSMAANRLTCFPFFSKKKKDKKNWTEEEQCERIKKLMNSWEYASTIARANNKHPEENIHT